MRTLTATLPTATILGTEIKQSSTWRGLYAIEFSLQAFAPVLKGVQTFVAR